MIAKIWIKRRTEEEPECFSFRYEEGMSIMDVLCQIREEGDPTLAFDGCCRSGKCGLCSLEVEGKPALACLTPAQETIHISPLRPFPVECDLEINRSGIQPLMDSLELHPIREKEPEEIPEQLYLGKNNTRFYQSADCVECLCCMAVCPLVQTGKAGFAGPMPLVRLLRYAIDPRDQANRSKQFKQLGADACRLCGRCETVCPMRIPIRDMIKEIQNQLYNAEQKG